MARSLRGAVAAAFTATDPEILVEGRAGTGKSIGILSKIHYLAGKYPSSRYLICRQTRVNCTESTLVTWEHKVLGQHHPLIVDGPLRTNRHSYEYPNGSSVVIGGLDKPGNLFSTEFDLIYVNEATEISLEAWELFSRALRNNKLPYQQLIADCNPGAPAHWLNERAFPCSDRLRAVETREDYERLQRYNHGPQEGMMRRLVSCHQDNPAYFDTKAWAWTEAGARYLETLSKMSGHRLQRMRYGRWIAADGTVFPEFDPERHVVHRPFEVPDTWPVYVGIDPGYDHPTAILWIAIAPNECMYVIDELYRGGMAVSQHAKDILARNAGRNVLGYYGDPQYAFSKNAQNDGQTIAQRYRPHGIRLQPWPRTGRNEQAMVEAVRERLLSDRFKVFATCQQTIREFQSWSHKRTRGGEAPDGDDKYEDRNNDTMDVIKGLVALNLRYRRGKIEVYGGDGE